ncbi:Cna B-type domain-containing protein [Ezakiella peruensis]|uniref:Cna B-type domain-containing protein n=1 Tax=Ezakiella peruensis TaxID=1464038 RepID=UPI000C1B2D5F|nr:Cna B-type domain-containing protein [Ezakiella peruensis]
MKKRVIIIFLTLLFTILAFGKVDLYAETTDEGTQLEETTLSEPASETKEDTKEEPEEAPQDVKEENETADENTEETTNVETKEETENPGETEEKTSEGEEVTEETTEEEKPEDQQTVSDAEEPVDQEEGKEEEITKDEKAEEETEVQTEVQTGEETEAEKETEVESEEQTETEVEEKTESEGEEKSEEKAEGEELEEGTIIDPENLNPLGASPDAGYKYVDSFVGLEDAIKEAKENTETTIVIRGSFEIEHTITIGANKIIVLTSNNKKPMDKWDPIKQARDFADKGEERQREIIEEGRRRGDKAIDDANKNITLSQGEYYYAFEDGEIVLKRSESFTGSLFEVKGFLTLGDKENSINFDGNKEKVKAKGGNNGSFFDINGGTLVLNNGVIANGETSGDDYNSPIRVKEDGKFIMNGGRITANKTKANGTVPYNAGAVDVSRGGHFIMNNGMIDHNISASGAVFVGNDGLNNTKILTEDKDFAFFEFKGGSIVSNKSKGYNLAGGITIFPTGKLNITDGIVANNYTGDKAGGIMVSDQYVRIFSNTINNSYSKTVDKPYEEYTKYNKAEANFNGGLLYKNETGYAGGAVFVDSDAVHFNKTMILDNKAAKFGGGVYVGFPPRVQELENILITENETFRSGLINENDDAWGGPLVGGGIWNCPDGYIHLGDGHSVYVFNNKGAMGGADYVFAKKTYSFELNGTDIHNQFYTFISPVTKEKHLIKFLNDSRKGTLLPKNMSYTDQFVYLKAIYDEALQREAWSNAGTFILGNEASYGAGLGSDAAMKSSQDIGDVEFKFKKHWDEDIDEDDYRWKDIHADIYIVPKDVDEIYVRSQYGYDNRLFKYGEVILNHDNSWEATFGKYKDDKYKDLPAYTMDKGLPFTNEELAKRGLKYLVIERERDYVSEVEQVKGEANSYEFTISNRPYTEAKIEKKWKMLTEEEIRQALGEYGRYQNIKNRDIPDQVTFYVLKDGKKIIVDYYRDEEGKVYPIYKTVTVTKDNDWKGVITKLDPKYLAKGAYGIEEEDLDGFEMSYEIKKVLVNEDEIKAYEEKLKEGNPINIEFYFRRYWTHYAADDVNRENSISNNPFKAENGDVTYNLYVDGKKVESKTATWQPKANGSGFWLDDENIVFGQDLDKKIVIDGKWKPVKVVHYNYKGDVSTIKNPEINMYLKKDEKGVYSLYLPYILENGKYVDLFYLEETTKNKDNVYETIYDLNPDAKPLAEIKPIYEYTFVATNTELPPEPVRPLTTNVRVNKVWEALGETTSIRVELYVNGEATGKYLTLSEANGWTATFYDLDEYDHLGSRYVYTVREVGDANGIYKLGDREFEVSYAGNMDKGFTITNKEIPPEEPEEPEEPETPEPKEPEEPEEPEDEGGGKNIIPKTGVKTDAKSIYLSLILLMALVVLKRKKYSK